VAMHSSQIDLEGSEKKDQMTNNIDSNFDKYDIKIEDIE
jgi:hypothetical protein